MENCQKLCKEDGKEPVSLVMNKRNYRLNMQRYDGKDARFPSLSKPGAFIGLRCVCHEAKAQNFSTWLTESLVILCVWHHNKSKALNLKVSFNTISKTNFHLFVSAIYHLHLIQLCALNERFSSARESKRAGVIRFACARMGLVFREGQSRVEGVSLLCREVGITLGNSRNMRKCESRGETEREKEKPDNRCKKLHASQNKSC